MIYTVSDIIKYYNSDEWSKIGVLVGFFGLIVNIILLIATMTYVFITRGQLKATIESHSQSIIFQSNQYKSEILSEIISLWGSLDSVKARMEINNLLKEINVPPKEVYITIKDRYHNGVSMEDEWFKLVLITHILSRLSNLVRYGFVDIERTKSEMAVTIGYWCSILIPIYSSFDDERRVVYVLKYLNYKIAEKMISPYPFDKSFDEQIHTHSWNGIRIERAHTPAP